MDYGESGKRIARDLVIGGSAKWNAGRAIAKQLHELKDASDNQKEGCLHDRFYLVYREGKAAISQCETKPLLRYAGKLPFIQWVLREYLTLSQGKVSPDTLKAFLLGVSAEKGLEEKEISLIRSTLACLLIARILSDTENPDLYESIRLLGRIPFEELHTSISPVERILSNSKDYPRMNERTRRAYRMAVATQSNKKQIAEWDYATDLLAREKRNGTPVGVQLFPDYGKDRRGTWLLPLVCSLVTLGFAGLLFYFYGIWCAITAFPLVYECFLRLARQRLRHDFLFGLDYPGGIPEEDATLCVVTTLLWGPQDIERLLRSTEEHFLREQGSGHFYFGLLLDLPDGDSPMTKEEEAWIETLSEKLSKLSQKHHTPFYAFIRKRTYQPSENRYIPFERKRGAILSLCALLGGKNSDMVSLSGAVPRVKYLITLDTDTVAHPESLRRLVETASHPMNQPKIKNGIVNTGFGILSPRLLPNPMEREYTRFSKYQAGHTGFSLYDTQDSGYYGALVGQSPFTGKGLLHVDLVNSILADRFPENTVLSHDIPEGGVLRCGLVGESVCYESTPETAPAWYKRLDRWTRGDMQNVTLLRRVGRAGRFFIMENIRGAFLPFSTFAYLSFVIWHGIFWGSIPLWLLLLWDFWVAVWSLWRQAGEYIPRFLTDASPVAITLKRSGIRFLSLPYEAWITQKAIWTALWRLVVTGKRRLLWNDGHPVPQTISAYARAIIPSSLVAGIILPIFLPVWLPAFLIFYFLSRKIPRAEVNQGDREYLRELCKDSMGVMRILCSAEWGYLPADHIQYYPYRGITKATSPTNIGMTLLAFLAYNDLNLPNAEEFLLYARQMMDTLEGLPRYRGHFYNWYDLNTMQPTDPKMISSVDSGNLCACLYSFASGIRAYGYTETACKAERLADEMGFDVFYDTQGKLLSVGIQADGTVLDNRYDLYESEARMASYLGCARGEMPLGHWNELGRPVLTWKGFAGAASWSGTMFEFLTPRIFLKSPMGTLCREGEAFSVMMQRLHGRAKHLPWGISESCFYAFDQEIAYRYKANGVSGTALAPRRNGEYNIAPYAACMALEYTGSVENLRHIQRLGGRGAYGFYEALDATDPDQVKAVECYMSHHIGMSIAAIANFLCDGIMRKRFLEHAKMRSALPLLWEAAPHGPKATDISGEAPPGSLGKGEGAKVFSRPGKDLPASISFLLDGHLFKLFADGHMESNNHKMTEDVLALSYQNTVTSVAPYPYYHAKSYTTFFSKTKALFTLRDTDYTAELLWECPEPGKLTITLTLHNRTDSPLSITLHRMKSESENRFRSVQQNKLSLSPGEIRSIPIGWL